MQQWFEVYATVDVEVKAKELAVLRLQSDLQHMEIPSPLTMPINKPRADETASSRLRAGE